MPLTFYSIDSRDSLIKTQVSSSKQSFQICFFTPGEKEGEGLTSEKFAGPELKGRKLGENCYKKIKSECLSNAWSHFFLIFKRYSFAIFQ